MSSELTNNLQTSNYTVFINSLDKVSGTNNNGTYLINWADLLTNEFDEYKMSFCMQTGGGKYSDVTSTFVINSITGNQASITWSSGVVCAGQTITTASVVNNGQTIYFTLASPIYIVSGTAMTAAGSQLYTISTSKWTSLAGLNLAGAGSVVYSGAKVQLETYGKSFSLDTSSLAKSNTLGYAQRDIQTATTSSNSFSCFYLQFPPKTVARPTQNLVTISLYNLNNGFLLTDTSSAGVPLTDCTPWNIILEFVPTYGSSKFKTLGN